MVGAKGVILIFNPIPFVQSEVLEKGVTIQMHLVTPRIKVLLLEVVTGPGGGVAATDQTIHGVRIWPKKRETFNPQTWSKTRSTDIRNNNVCHLGLI